MVNGNVFHINKKFVPKYTRPGVDHRIRHRHHSGTILQRLGAGEEIEDE